MARGARLWGHTCKPPERVMAGALPWMRLDLRSRLYPTALPKFKAQGGFRFVLVPTHTPSRDAPKVSWVRLPLTDL